MLSGAADIRTQTTAKLALAAKRGEPWGDSIAAPFKGVQLTMKTALDNDFA
jgi:hypothetical protein